MGRKQRKSSPGDSRPKPAQAATRLARSRGASAATDGRRHLRGWRLWAARLAVAVAIPVVLLVAAEGALRLTGWGYPTAFCLPQREARVWTDNDRFLWQFYSRKTNLRPTPFAVTSDKPADTVRLVILGESAAAGTPEPACGFARILERMLCHQFPQRRIEVINAAMRGVNSHILVRVARDGACLKPDLFVVYMGNNEAVGLYAPGPHSGRLTPHLGLLRAIQWVRTTRLGELLESPLQGLGQEQVTAEKQDAAFFEAHRVPADDPRRAAVYDNFRANLTDICQAAHKAGAGVVAATVAVNLKDCPPLGSLHRAHLSEPDKARWETAYAGGTQAETAGQHAQAIIQLSAAAAVDDHYADLHFHLARCCAALGQLGKAQEEYTLARDWDALPFRADSRLNEIIRQTAARSGEPSIRLVDAERAFAASELSDHGLPGERLFHDHVHPNFDGDYLLARTFLPAVVEALADKLGRPSPPAKPILARDECAAQLAFTRVMEAQIAAAMVQQTSEPPFTGQFDHDQRQKDAERRLAERFGSLTRQDMAASHQAFRAAIQRAPDDWQLRYVFARLLLLSRDFPAAIEQFEAARRLLPHALLIRVGLGNALSNAGRYDEALQVLNEALALDPQSETVKAGLAAVRAQRRKAGGP